MDFDSVWDEYPGLAMLRAGLLKLELELEHSQPDVPGLNLGLDMLAVAAVACELGTGLDEATDVWVSKCVSPLSRCPRCGEDQADNLAFVPETGCEFVECQTCGWGYTPGTQM